jgi:ferritin heavy chain
MAHQHSQIRQNFATKVEAAINKQISIELHASYVYLSMVSTYSILIS